MATKHIHNQEEKQLNNPTRDYFKKKVKCSVARTEFSFFAGKLDVLAYNRNEKCFHISEGKRSKNVASIGHAIGQLIAYMSMIQEKGYDFLNQISKEEHLELSDFSNFLEEKQIRVCFYVTLPKKDQDNLLPSAKLMLKNLGDFGSSIGLFFADTKNCELLVPAQPILIKLRKTYSRDEFLSEATHKISQMPEVKGLAFRKTRFDHLIQIKEKIGNPYLHFEICARKLIKDVGRTVEIAFHLEFASSHLKSSTFSKRKKKLQALMKKAHAELLENEEDFKLQLNWGKNWSRLYSGYKIGSKEFDQDDLEETLRRFKVLLGVLKPKFDEIHWGRNKKLLN